MKLTTRPFYETCIYLNVSLVVVGGFFYFHLVLNTNILASYWCWRMMFLQETHFQSLTLKVKSVCLPKPSHYSCLLLRLTALVTPQMCAVFATKRRSNQPPGKKLRSRDTDWSVQASGSPCSTSSNSSNTDRCDEKCQDSRKWCPSRDDEETSVSRAESKGSRWGKQLQHRLPKPPP